MRKNKLLEPEEIRQKLADLVVNFEEELRTSNLRGKVLSLVPLFHALRDLGKSLLPLAPTSSARERILFYFRKYPYTVINGDEFLVVSGIQEYARRIRELRVQFGWSIISGITAKEMAKEEEFPLEHFDVSKMAPDDYILLSEEQDRDAAFRWKVANEIRKKKGSVRSKILEYLKMNVGKPITGEELRYVANNRTEWARRSRELRTELGWPVITRNTGRPDLPIGTYVLESVRQSPEHDRQIPDRVRRAVLRRDGYKCTRCAWTHDLWNPSDPRHLEIHHVKEHAKGGENKHGEQSGHSMHKLS
ncbi:MAG: HNH endonuclease [Nitrospirae bacterium]|nr:HNH endonuclease [Nitrospirota bacterium]